MANPALSAKIVENRGVLYCTGGWIILFHLLGDESDPGGGTNFQF